MRACVHARLHACTRACIENMPSIGEWFASLLSVDTQGRTKTPQTRQAHRNVPAHLLPRHAPPFHTVSRRGATLAQPPPGRGYYIPEQPLIIKDGSRRRYSVQPPVEKLRSHCVVPPLYSRRGSALPSAAQYDQRRQPPPVRRLLTDPCAPHRESIRYITGPTRTQWRGERGRLADLHNAAADQKYREDCEAASKIQASDIANRALMRRPSVEDSSPGTFDVSISASPKSTERRALGDSDVSVSSVDAGDTSVDFNISSQGSSCTQSPPRSPRLTKKVGLTKQPAHTQITSDTQVPLQSQVPALTHMPATPQTRTSASRGRASHSDSQYSSARHFKAEEDFYSQHELDRSQQTPLSDESVDLPSLTAMSRIDRDACVIKEYALVQPAAAYGSNEYPTSARVYQHSPPPPSATMQRAPLATARADSEHFVSTPSAPTAYAASTNAVRTSPHRLTPSPTTDWTRPAPQIATTQLRPFADSTVRKRETPTPNAQTRPHIVETDRVGQIEERIVRHVVESSESVISSGARSSSKALSGDDDEITGAKVSKLPFVARHFAPSPASQSLTNTRPPSETCTYTPRRNDYSLDHITTPSTSSESIQLQSLNVLKKIAADVRYTLNVPSVIHSHVLFYTSGCRLRK